MMEFARQKLAAGETAKTNSSSHMAAGERTEPQMDLAQGAIAGIPLRDVGMYGGVKSTSLNQLQCSVRRELTRRGVTPENLQYRLLRSGLMLAS